MDRLLALVAVVAGLAILLIPWALRLVGHQATVAAIIAGGALVAAVGLVHVVHWTGRVRRDR
jgi:hypothetical protein